MQIELYDSETWLPAEKDATKARFPSICWLSTTPDQYCFIANARNLITVLLEQYYNEGLSTHFDFPTWRLKRGNTWVAMILQAKQKSITF